MNNFVDFIDIGVLGTIAGSSAIITMLTQVMKQYLPKNVDTKWLALVLSIIVGIVRIIYIGQFDFDGIVSGIINIFILLSVSIGIYEIGDSISNKFIGGKTSEKESDDNG